MEEIVLLGKNELSLYPALDQDEKVMIEKAQKLIQVGFPEHALLEIWNSAIHNLRRRIEAYSIDMFLSNIDSMSGRKKYNRDGDTLSERWSGVDDDILIKASNQLGVLNKKAEKALQMIQWMRNHASPSHDCDECVTQEDVVGLVLIIKKNLFEYIMPDPAHSPVSLINPIKSTELTEEQIELIKQQILSFNKKDIRMLFGFALDAICNGIEPTYSNVISLFEDIWDNATEDLKTVMGMKYHNYIFDSSNDSSDDVNAKTRLYEMLIKVNGVKYIPDSTRAIVYRKLAKDLANAKNTMYGWASEERAAKALAQAGAYVPSIAFEEVYQEILSVWCGNFWGKSGASAELKDFIFSLPLQDKLKVCRLFNSNERVREELFQLKPNREAISLLSAIKNTFNIQSHISEIEEIIERLKSMLGDSMYDFSK